MENFSENKVLFIKNKMIVNTEGQTLSQKALSYLVNIV